VTKIAFSIAMVLLAAEAAKMPGSGYAEWTALAALIAIVIFLVFKTLPKRDIDQQTTITSLMAQTDALRTTLQRLTEVVASLSQRQVEIAEVVTSNQKIQELAIKQMDTLQIVVTEIMRTLVDARMMMEPVPKLREEQNALLREMLETLKKSRE